jgi:Methyltransferase domain
VKSPQAGFGASFALESLVMTGTGPDWIGELQKHYLRTLTFREIRTGVVALSKIYVEKRSGIDRGAVFDGAAKRAAFACFYSPLHFLTVSFVVTGLGAGERAFSRIVDLGCGLGVAGAAWARASSGEPTVVGFEKNPWAVDEARHLLGALGVQGRVHRKALETAPLPGAGDAVVAAFTVNELEAETRERLLDRLLDAAARGASILVIEPIARRGNPWWSEWSERFVSRSGRDDSWRFATVLPEPLLALDRASGLDHRELTARSLFLPGASEGA